MDSEDDLGEALETEMNRRVVNWGNVRRLCEEIDRQRKQADSVAKRLLGVPIFPDNAAMYDSVLKAMTIAGKMYGN